MKYQNLKSFQKHLVSAAPHHLCRLYLIGIADDFERGQALQAVLAHLPSSPTRFTGADCALRDVLDAMQSMTLLGDAPVVVLDEVEKLSKKEQQTLSEHLLQAAAYVLLGARSKTSLAPLVEQEGVILDLLEEKVWEREKRLLDQLSEQAKGAQKKLTSEAAALLLERLGPDAALLENELAKLICYVGERSVIGKEEVLLLSPASRTATIWQIAEEVIWEGGEFPVMEPSSFHSLVPALRQQLHIGLTLATLIVEKRPADQWSRFLPKLWPKTLEKRSSQAARLSASFFRKGLDQLFSMELLSRTDSTQYRALLDAFRAHLYAR